MAEIIDFLTSAKLMELAADPRVLFLAAVVFVVAILMRWKLVLLLLFGVGATLVVIHYTNPGAAGGPADAHMPWFIAGILAVAVILIYYIFIKGD
jgi:lipoprotein signal peptidase